MLESRLPIFIQKISPQRLAPVLITYLEFRDSNAQHSWELMLQTISQLIQNGSDPKAQEAAKNLLSFFARSERLPKFLGASNALLSVVTALLDSTLRKDVETLQDTDINLLAKLLERRGKAP